MKRKGCFPGCFGTVVAGALLVATAYAGWRWGPAVFPRLDAWLGLASEVPADAREPSLDVSQDVLDRLQTFVEEGPGEGDVFVIDGVELTSLLRFGSSGLVPPGVDEPSVVIEDGRMELSARIVLDRFPEFPDLDGLPGFLPDTIPLEVEATIMPFEGRQAAIVVQSVSASNIPIPRRFHAPILEALGRRDQRGLPPEAVAIPLPEGLRSIYIAGDCVALVVDR